MTRMERNRHRRIRKEKKERNVSRVELGRSRRGRAGVGFKPKSESAIDKIVFVSPQDVNDDITGLF